MTVGATTNMGYGAMGMNGLGYNDPYFIQAYQSPNSNYQLAQQQAQMAQQAQAQMAAQSATPTAGANPSFQGGATQAIQTEAKEEKSGSAAKWILGIATVAGLAWGGYKCFKKGNGEGLAKLWDGAKQYWDDGCKWVKGLFGKSADKADDVAAAVTQNKPPVTIPTPATPGPAPTSVANGSVVGMPTAVREAIEAPVPTVPMSSTPAPRPRRANGQFMSNREIAQQEMIENDYLTSKPWSPFNK